MSGQHRFGDLPSKTVTTTFFKLLTLILHLLSTALSSASMEISKAQPRAIMFPPIDCSTVLKQSIRPYQQTGTFTSSTLPAEILYLIFEYLSVGDRTTVLQLNRHWHYFMMKSPSMWQHLDFAYINVNSTILDLVLARSNHTVTRCSIRVATDCLEPSLSRCRKLRKLKLGLYLEGSFISRQLPIDLPQDLPNLKMLTVDQPVLLHNVINLMNSFPSLKVAYFVRLMESEDTARICRIPSKMKELKLVPLDLVFEFPV